MGKKKSVVLMTLLTIVIVVLCALTAFPAIPLGNSIYRWEPIVANYDFGADLGGGYYTYYYPKGVIAETEYDMNLATLQEAGDQTEIDKYQGAYKQFDGLYLSTDEDDGVLNSEGAVTATFQAQFDAFAKEVAKRFEKKEYSDYRVAVVDGYSVRVELPKAENQVSDVFNAFAMTGEVTLEVDGEKVEELTDEVTAKDLIKSISVANRYKTTYLKVQFTAKGKAMVARVKGDLSEQASSSSSSSAKTLDIKVGDNKIVSIYKDAIMSGNAEARPMAIDQRQGSYIETYSILLNSALSNPLELSLNGVNDVRQFSPVYGKSVVTLLYIALGIVLLASLIVPVIAMGKFGIVSGYGTLSYFIVAGICFKYLTGGVFAFTPGTVLVFLAGLAVMHVLQWQLYRAIKQFDGARAVASAVKEGYKQTIWGVVDIYVVLLLSAIVMLFAGAGLFTVALQAIVCIVTGAFCNLLWLRAINFIFLSAHKDKEKYFRFAKKEDDGDE